MDLTLEKYPQAITMISFMFISIEFTTLRTFFENSINTRFLGYNTILVFFVMGTLLSLVLSIKKVRNVHRLPQDPGFVGFILQFLAISLLLTPKLIFISNALVLAPFCFPIGYAIELLVVLGYNWMVFGNCQGKNYMFFNLIFLQMYLLG